MLQRILIITAILAVGLYADHQAYPGTSTRPVLSDPEAAEYTKEKYLQGWTPSTIQTSSADYVVGSGGYETIQEAVNVAVTAGGTTRKYIKIQPGTYAEAVMIPKTTVPLTLYGTPGSSEDVHIILSIGAAWNGAKYSSVVNPDGAIYKEGDPAWSMYNYCANKETLGSCAAVVWTQNDDLEVAYVTVENPSIDGQALAVKSDGDKQYWDNVHFYGFQDTLMVNGARAYFYQPKIKGDVDFIFGPAAAVFESAQITARADRPRDTAIIFAPNTDKDQKYGFLLINSKITADDAIKAKKGCHLARAWDATSTPNANGQLVIRDTEISDVINVNAPYDTATSGRTYSGNTNTNRNLDDSNYNRFWEYKNTGDGA